MGFNLYKKVRYINYFLISYINPKIVLTFLSQETPVSPTSRDWKNQYSSRRSSSSRGWKTGAEHCGLKSFWLLMNGL